MFKIFFQNNNLLEAILGIIIVLTLVPLYIVGFGIEHVVSNWNK